MISLIQLNQISIKFDLSLYQIFPWIYLLKTMLISLISGFIIYTIGFNCLSLFDNDLFNNIVIIIIGFIFYSLIFCLLGLLTKTFKGINILNIK